MVHSKQADLRLMLAESRGCQVGCTKQPTMGCCTQVSLRSAAPYSGGCWTKALLPKQRYLYCSRSFIQCMSDCRTAWVWHMHAGLPCQVAAGCQEGSSAHTAHGGSAAFVHCLDFTQWFACMSIAETKRLPASERLHALCMCHVVLSVC